MRTEKHGLAEPDVKLSGVAGTGRFRLSFTFLTISFALYQCVSSPGIVTAESERLQTGISHHKFD